MVKKTIKKDKKTKVSKHSVVKKSSRKKRIFFMGLMLFIVSISLVVGYSYGKREGVVSCPKCDNGVVKYVVKNPGKKAKIPVCGLVLKNGSCIFYVLNHSSYDKFAEDFFYEVSSKTGRSIFNIRLENSLYAKKVISPGRFAEIIVPALK